MRWFGFRAGELVSRTPHVDMGADMAVTDVSSLGCAKEALLGGGRGARIVRIRKEVSVSDVKRAYNGLGNITNPDAGKVGKLGMS